MDHAAATKQCITGMIIISAMDGQNLNQLC